MADIRSPVLVGFLWNAQATCLPPSVPSSMLVDTVLGSIYIGTVVSGMFVLTTNDWNHTYPLILYSLAASSV